MLVDLRPKKLNGKISEASLEHAGMTCNKNGIPFDTEKPTITSGIRLGTPAATTRGFGADEFRQVGKMIVKVLDALAANPQNNGAVEQEVRKEVSALCKRFPIYS
jgi:glycine hydroxymethyltransferase